MPDNNDGVFDIIFYKNSAELNRVDKTQHLHSMATISGVLRDECSIIEPAIIIERDTIPTFNYAYIPILNRYYFITNITSIRKNLWEVEMEVDVLMTYKDAIYRTYAFVDRNEIEYNKNIIDKKRVVEQGVDIVVSEVPNDWFATSLNIEPETGKLFVLSGYKLRVV